MLSDLLALEAYFGSAESALFFEDLSRQYSPRAIRRALQEGYITGRQVRCGPDCGRRLFWLTEKGRHRAQTAL